MFLESIDEDSATGDTATWYRSQREAWGYLPNYAPAFASRGEVGLAWPNLNLTIRGGMDRRRFELVTLAAARARNNTYCMAAHAKFMRDVVGDEPTMLEVAADPAAAALDDVDQALVAYATKVAADPASVTAQDVAGLRELGLSDADVADVIFAVAARCFFATVLDATGAQADQQLAGTFAPQVQAELTVGRPFASSGPTACGLDGLPADCQRSVGGVTSG